jgi:glycolate oxidase iron-sulfur subunit
MTMTPLQKLADECVMCGLCLPHCPTFRLSGQETRSPRGRIALAKLLEAGTPVDDSVRNALDSCLQCRACESVCPAKVRYGDIIDEARAALNPQGRLPSVWLGWLRAREQFVAASLALAGRAARIWPALTRRLGRRARWLLRARRPVTPISASRADTVLFGGCVARAFDSAAQHAMLSVAGACKLALLPAAGQQCCGAMARHVGAGAVAQAQADSNQSLWARMQTREIVALDSGCIDALRHSAGSAVRVIEACRWLLDQRQHWPALQTSVPLRVGLFSPCSHRHAVGDAQAPAQLLAALPGLEVVPIGTGLGCCGAAGPHLLAHPEQADALAAPLVEAIRALNLDALATTNVGCALHLSERLALHNIKVPLRHPVAFLADLLRSSES